MNKIILIFLLCFSLNATEKKITPDEVYSEVMLITDEIDYLLKHYRIKHDHEGITTRAITSTKLKPRNVWQMTYEILVKINILRELHKLPVIEPVNIVPVLDLNPDLVYEQALRIETELKIFMIRQNIKLPSIKRKTFKAKKPLDVFIGFNHISYAFDELNGGKFTSSYVFAEQMRIYDDITIILEHLKINNNTIPKNKNVNATLADVFKESMKILDKIKQLQIISGIDFVNFSEFKKGNETTAEVYTITQMILSELQTIKAYLGILKITPAASNYNTKTPAEVEQLVSWNLRKLNLIHSLNKR